MVMYAFSSGDSAGEESTQVVGRIYFLVAIGLRALEFFADYWLEASSAPRCNPTVPCHVVLSVGNLQSGSLLLQGQLKRERA